jgi:hypothetical protein
VVEELYLTTLNRPPTETEKATAIEAFIGADKNRKTATEDLFWALLNSPEFILNH